MHWNTFTGDCVPSAVTRTAKAAGTPAPLPLAVKIPGAEEHRSPKEFREDLLKAMKQGVPGPYRDLVRKYYEEIVR